MAVDFKRRREQTGLTPLLIDLGDGDTINITYRKNRVTTGQTTRMSELMRAAKIADAGGDDTATATAGLVVMNSQIEQFLETVASWDATDDGIPVPLTREGLDAHEVDIELLNFIIAKIGEDNRPNSTTGNS